MTKPPDIIVYSELDWRVRLIKDPPQWVIERKATPKSKTRSGQSWCPLDQPCHADVLLRVANEQPRKCQVCGVEIPGCDICGTESNDETCDWCEECAG